jgi:hypothetical protein
MPEKTNQEPQTTPLIESPLTPTPTPTATLIPTPTEAKQEVEETTSIGGRLLSGININSW